MTKIRYKGVYTNRAGRDAFAGGHIYYKEADALKAATSLAAKRGGSNPRAVAYQMPTGEAGAARDERGAS